MSLASQLSSAFTQIGTDVGKLKELLNGDAIDLAALTTTNKANLVAALNEVKAAVDTAATLSDTTTTTTSTWSSNKISTQINAAIAGILDGAPAALDTLNELAAALNDDAGVINTLLAAQAKRVAVDQVQAFTAAEKLQGCSNLDIGDPGTNFLSTYTTARDAP
tara:strand:+ start:27952 stop:28443 length:492 start_codon:yes stop_codon:yes gene_type:complete